MLPIKTDHKWRSYYQSRYQCMNKWINEWVTDRVNELASWTHTVIVTFTFHLNISAYRLSKTTQLSAQNEQKAREKQRCLHRCNGIATNSIRDTFWVLAQVLAILILCSSDVGIGDTFPVFLAIFDTNIFVVRCTSQVYINNNITVTERVKTKVDTATVLPH